MVHALAGRIKDNKKLTLKGNRYINGQPVAGDAMIPAAFIEQDVNFFPHMTVRETLAFRVSLKLGSLVGKSEQDRMVNSLMKQLGLTKSADTQVGNAKVRGISGGERKRLSIAVEMISSPAVIFLDGMYVPDPLPPHSSIQLMISLVVYCWYLSPPTTFRTNVRLGQCCSSQFG